MSHYLEADNSLAIDFLSDYIKLRELTNVNTVALGQFVELRLQKWLKQIIAHPKQDLRIGTGYVYFEGQAANPKNKKGQCDVIVYRGQPLFIQDDLVVVEQKDARLIIEIKAGMTTNRALKQINELRQRASHAIFYLFALEPREKWETIIAKLYQQPFDSLPDTIVILNKKGLCTLEVDKRKKKIFERKGRSYNLDEVDDVIEFVNSPAMVAAGVSPTQAVFMGLEGYDQSLSAFAGKLVFDIQFGIWMGK